MTPKLQRFRPVHYVLGLLTSILLAGCTVDPLQYVFSPREVEEQEPFVAVPATQAWVNPDQIAFVMQRGLLGGSEQRIGLLNDVAVQGDNQLVLRTRSGTFAAPRFNFDEFMSRIGGAPLPFATVRSGDLLTEEDAFGPYFWTSQTFGSDVVCVFAVRRVSADQRNLPNGAQVMDIMLRNCVRGSAEAALRPILSESVSFARNAAIPSEAGRSRLLSPLAAPGLR